MPQVASGAFKRWLKSLAGWVVVLGLLAGGGYALVQGWIPGWRSSAETEVADDHEHDHAAEAGHGGGGSNSLTLSEQALATLDIRTALLKPADYERTIRIPAQVRDIPGVSTQIITARASGEVIKIYVRPGQLVEPGERLFEISLTHEEAIEKQLELLEALAKLEVINAEIDRLARLEQQSPGAIAGSRLLQQRYEQRHLQHTVNSRAQMLVLLGLSDEAVEQLIRRHQEQHEGGAKQEHDKLPLVDAVTISAPAVESTGGGAGDSFVMEKLLVSPGQHMDVGNTLAQLGNYSHLQLEGQAFERDLDLVRHAMQQGWKVTATFSGLGGETERLENLAILYVAPSIDAANRSASFYVELPNTLRTLTSDKSQPAKAAALPADYQVNAAHTRPYADWQFRPGQRAELRVPVERFPNSLVVPLAAVAQDGLNHYVFQVSGQTVARRAVSLRHRDAEYAVLDDPDKTLEGMRIAVSGAYQLQLAFLNRASGPVDPHAGHNH